MNTQDNTGATNSDACMVNSLSSPTTGIRLRSGPYQSALHAVAEVASIFYTEYCRAVGGKAFNGDPLPSWEKFATDVSKRKQAFAYLKATASVIDEVSKYAARHILPQNLDVDDFFEPIKTTPVIIPKSEFCMLKTPEDVVKAIGFEYYGKLVDGGFVLLEWDGDHFYAAKHTRDYGISYTFAEIEAVMILPQHISLPQNL